jgi:hypothetical protein
VPTTPYSPGGGTTAHSVLTSLNKPQVLLVDHWSDGELQRLRAQAVAALAGMPVSQYQQKVRARRYCHYFCLMGFTNGRWKGARLQTPPRTRPRGAEAHKADRSAIATHASSYTRTTESACNHGRSCCDTTPLTCCLHSGPERAVSLAYAVAPSSLTRGRLLCHTAVKKSRIGTLGVSGGRALTRPLRDARRFPSPRL